MTRLLLAYICSFLEVFLWKEKAPLKSIICIGISYPWLSSAQILLLYHLAMNQGKVVADMEEQDILAHFECAFRKLLEGKHWLSDVMCGVQLRICCAREN